jgi:hypothetical protein
LSTSCGRKKAVTVYAGVSVGWLEGERLKALAEIENAEARIREQVARAGHFEKMLEAAREANAGSAAPSAVATMYAGKGKR